jgi:UV DNA damage endonuclease
MTHSEQCRFRTITRSRYLSLGEAERERALEGVYWDNLNRLHGAISFCARAGIKLYRMPSSLFPMSDEPAGDRIMRSLGSLMSGVGRRAERLGIRVLMHPEQFVVLSSDSRKVIRTSIAILCKLALSMDLMGLPRSPWSTMIVHGGRGGRGRFLAKMIPMLPEEIRTRLSLENDEYAYGADEILDVCQRAGVPMVFDNHHHVIHDKLADPDDPSIERYVRLAAGTWPDPSWQLVHLSNGAEGIHDQRHSDLIDTFPRAYASVPWIEVEAKGKERAIAALRSTLG